MILPSWMKIRVAFLPLVKLSEDRVDVFAAHGSVMYSLFYFPLVIEGFCLKTVGDRSFEFLD
jgi:hypothetical protein